MERQAEPIALFDMDGTLCDFAGAMERALESLRGPNEELDVTDPHPSEELPHMKARRRLIKTQPGFWLNLERLTLGFQVYDMARELKFTTHILTKGPRRSPNAYSEKMQWCEKHVPESLVTISEDKGLVYGKFLVDDWPEYITRWLEWRGRGWVFMPDQPWNKDFEHPRVIRITQDTLGQIKEKMIEIRATAGD